MGRLEYINNLRFPLIVGIVLAHANHFIPAIVRDEGITSILFKALQTVFINGVAVFFIISGYLFFRGVKSFDKSLYVKKLRSRVHTLLIPYILWTLIFALYVIAKHIPDIVQTHSLDSIRNLFTWRIFWSYKEGLPLHFVLWYVRDLMVMCLISPIIWFLITRLKHFAMLGIWLFFIKNSFDNSVSFPLSTFYFSLGSYLAICDIDIQRISQKLGWSILLIAGTALVGSLQENLMLIRFSHMTFAMCSVAFSCFLTNKYQCKLPSTLTESVFFIYASHTVLVMIVSHHIFSALIPDTAHPVWLFIRLFLDGFLTVAICLSIFTLLRKFCPKVLSMLTGDRRYNEPAYK